jgi:DNA-binding response OmpR family regulator
MQKPLTQILVIEDEPHIRQDISQILELLDYEIAIAKNGQAGVKLAKELQPNLILCDIIMPKLDGYGVVQAIRHNQITAHIPIILLTSKTDRSAQRQGMESGADDYLTKPFTPEELLKAVAIRLERQGSFEQRLNQNDHQVHRLKEEREYYRSQWQQSIKSAHRQGNLLRKLTEDLSNPMSTINLAVRRLQEANSEEQRTRYLQILQQECNREIQMLKETKELQNSLTPETAHTLKQFDLLTSES